MISTKLKTCCTFYGPFSEPDLLIVGVAAFGHLVMFVKPTGLILGECGSAGCLLGVNVCTLAAAASQLSAGREQVRLQFQAQSLLTFFLVFSSHVFFFIHLFQLSLSLLTLITTLLVMLKCICGWEIFIFIFLSACMWD